MSLSGLLNKTCTIYKKTRTSVSDEGEVLYDDTIVASNVPCCFQLETERKMELFEASEHGDSSQSLYTVFFNYGVEVFEDYEILVNDPIFQSNRLTVIAADNATGRNHHLEILCKHRKAL